MISATRLFDLLDAHAKATPDQVFISSKKQPDAPHLWKHYTFSEFQQLANRTSQLLMNLNLKSGNTIAIISGNRAEWNLVDLGAQQIGVIDIPMYPTFSEKDYQFILQDAEVQYVFAEDDVIVQKVLAVRHRCASLKGVISFDHASGADYFWDMLPSSEQFQPVEINKHKADVIPEHLATIIYTSGTTGNPKGVMLMHENILSNVFSVMQMAPFLSSQKKTLSFLPLCHSFERTVFYVYLAFGIHIHYAENLDTLSENLKETRPYCFTTVPRLLEKVYEKIMAKGAALSGLKKKLFFWAIATGEKFRIGEPQGLWFQVKLLIARRLIFSKWIDALGGQIRYVITGAAAMQPRLITLFTSAGIQVIEGYGLTETSPVLTLNGHNMHERCLGTVGMPIPGVEVTLASDGEILARGSNIMKGYYNRPDLTAEVIRDGWFHTGDIGEWVNHRGNKFLKITDRKKELFKTAGGKYIAPQVIEMKMKEIPFIEQIMVVGGDDKKFISALVVPSFVLVENWMMKKGLKFNSRMELVSHQAVLERIQSEVNIHNEQFGHWEQIKKITLLDKEWSPATGELTPTMKLKRKVICEKYRSEIQQMYVES